MPRIGERKRRDRDPKTTPICVYCCKRPSVKREHVVAKVFFNPPYPDNMITVPSCDECDSGKGDGGERDLHLDESYMRNVLCIREDIAATNPVARKLAFSKVVRSFEKDRALAAAVFSTFEPIHVWTPQLSLATGKNVYTVRHARIEWVVRKITRGLYFHRERRPLPADAVVQVQADLTPEQFDVFLPLFPEPHWFGLDDHVFRYKSARFWDRPDHVVCLMVFYQSFAAVALTLAPQDAERLNRQPDSAA